MSTTTRHIGNCQICEADQKLHDGRLVHHGYKRPGDGYIVGDCPGVHAVPYEVSCELIKTYKEGVEYHLANKEAFLAKLKAGEVTKLTELKYRGAWKKSELVEYSVGVTEAHIWNRVLSHKISEVEGAIRYAKFDIERCTRRIAAWQPLPLRTVEEEQAKEDADKAARKAVKDAERAVRDAKKAATKAKQDALAARRQTIKDEFVAAFKALAALPKSPDRDQDVRLLCDKLHAKKNRRTSGCGCAS